MGKWTKGALRMSQRMISRDLPNAISSQGVGDGQSPSAPRCGLTLDLFGQEVAPVNRLARRGKIKAKMTRGICGLYGLNSSSSRNLQQSLENRLRELLPTDGPMKSSMIWKATVTPLRERYCRLVLSRRLMKENGSGLWHTPRTLMIDETPENF